MLQISSAQISVRSHEVFVLESCFLFLVACGSKGSRQWRSRHIKRVYYGGIPRGIFDSASHWKVSGKNTRDSPLYASVQRRRNFGEAFVQ